MDEKMKFYEKELNYLKSITPEKPGYCFDNNPSIFARYCDIQVRITLRAGYYLIAYEMLDIRNIAIHHTGMIRTDWERENNGYHQKLILKKGR